MITLVAISGLGIICLLLEILNLRKILIPVVLIGLVGILGSIIYEYCTGKFIYDMHSYHMISNTGFSHAFSGLFVILATLIIAMSPQFYHDKKTKIADYISLKIFLLAGAVAMVSFSNLAMFFIGLEIVSICGYVLASSNPQSIKSNEAGMKYFIMGAFASSFILFGIALVYGATGSFDTETINAITSTQHDLPIWLNLGFVMILIGLLFKASIVPFHFWAPDVYEGSPTLVTALMSTLVKVAAIAALCKVVAILYAAFTPTIQIAIIVLSILSMIVGNITALKQSNLKRLMAYSGISHAGFMIMGLLAVDGVDFNTVLYYATAYSLAALAGFAVIMAVCEGKENENISNIYGLAKRKPLMAVLMTCALLSLGGIPVFAGFFAKMFLFTDMFEANHIVLVILGVINSIIAIYYYFSTASVMFTKEPSTDQVVCYPTCSYIIVACIAITLNLIIGLFPSIIMDLIL